MTTSAKRKAWTAELTATLSLVWPIVLTNVAQTLMGATDVWFLSKIGPDALAAGAVGTNLYYLTFFIGLGFALAVAPVLAKEIGENSHEVRRVRQTVHAMLSCRTLRSGRSPFARPCARSAVLPV